MKKMLKVWAAAAALVIAGAALPALAATRTETLKNGGKLEIDGGKVYIVEGPDMRKNDPEVKLKSGDFRMRKAAEDGSYTLKSGKTLVVKDGQLVEDKSSK